MTKLNREIVLQTLKGYEEVNRITARERRERVGRMTDKEARKLFNDLHAGATILPLKEEKKLMSFRHVHRVKLRTAMEKLSRSLGHDPTI